ncbi:preprotein translocase subunit SecG [Candidatus Woesebacteria bacterium]|nr:preprotein translocase subunit SecG [Candidatus Woesebacteria bacterium]
MAKTVLLVLQIIVSLVLIGVILIQAKGTGLGRTFGATSVSFTRRGLEKLIFKLTFVLTGLFILLSILQLLV